MTARRTVEEASLSSTRARWPEFPVAVVIQWDGEGFVLDRIDLPFGIHAGPDQCVFTRWRPPR